VLSVLDARAGQVYAAVFDIKAGMVTRLTDDTACVLRALDPLITPDMMAVGDGAKVAADFFAHRGLHAAPYRTAVCAPPPLPRRQCFYLMAGGTL
jgi:tRNA A37 threonylcarbamoyladenosine modification protein TsaB